jgi:hypothetical protein
MRHLAELALALLTLLGLYVAFLLSPWLPPMPAEPRDALALMQAPLVRAVGEHDAFPRLWLLRQDVPEAEITTLFAEDREAILRAAPDVPPESDLPSLARYPREPLDSGSLCPRAPQSCLAYVREDPKQARGIVQAHLPLLARATALREADHVRYGFTANPRSPVPPLGGIGNLQAMATALRFEEGDHGGALESACTDLATWRRLRARTDMLLMDMVGIAFAGTLAHLVAEMLAELPPDHPLPEACAHALAPEEPGEFDQCDVWRGEFALVSNVMTGLAAGETAELASEHLPPVFNRLLLKERATLGLSAQHYARLCAGREHLAPAEPGWLDRAFNPVGSILIAVAAPNLDDYRDRAEDFRALMQAMRLLVWLRGQADPAVVLGAPPAEFATPRHALRVDVGAASVAWDRLNAPRGESATWSLPLAGSRLDEDVAAADAGGADG